jgi:hypothetical protein
MSDAMPLHNATDPPCETFDDTGNDADTRRVVLETYLRAFRASRSGSSAFEAAVDAFTARFPQGSRSIAYRRAAEIICAADEAACRRIGGVPADAVKSGASAKN